jgi:hypothetical protein
MTFDLAAALPRLAPKAVAWAEARASEILATGEPLTAQGLAIAREVGVADPGRIRILFVPRIPRPTDPDLRRAAEQTGLLGPGVIGLTLGHGIYIRKGHDSPRLLAHECRHVHQYEQAGSIAAFLPRYLEQIARFGYANAPYELDARAHEI